jgi:hypothetical protein
MVLLSLLLGMVGTTWGMIRAARANTALAAAIADDDAETHGLTHLPIPSGGSGLSDGRQKSSSIMKINASSVIPPAYSPRQRVSQTSWRFRRRVR